MNLWTRRSSPTLVYVFSIGERPRWVWDPKPGRIYISGGWGILRQAFYRIAILLGWRPIISMTASPPDPASDDGLLGSRIPLRSPDSSGSASAEAVPGGDSLASGIARR